ncbi:hypothetical protein [Chondromyces crocatus]|uniref:Uncharacterized protein n=1 Tax=Chondromyces crocatus TaxID=52 RepID=A0A0K1ESY5_CHOCO|nr:hypothetical protein [Chondromyces crocatus]AKT44045.1 uncharacterized protein CMC5_082830 [Chondromyces crocatus]
MHRSSLLHRTALAAALGLALAAGGAAAIADPPKGGYSPDPAGIPSRTQWVFDVYHHKGQTSLLGARSVTLARPAASARILGRFAVEFYVGKELVDRVRFNVPLTGDAPQKDPRRPFRHPTFDESVTTRMKVQMADSPRATWGRLVDRMTGAEQRFWWPPEKNGRLTPMSEPPGGVAARDAGADGGAADASAPAIAVDPSEFVDGGPTDGGPIDGGPTDGGPTDGGPTDGGPTDGGPTPRAAPGAGPIRAPDAGAAQPSPPARPPK